MIELCTIVGDDTLAIPDNYTQCALVYSLHRISLNVGLLHRYNAANEMGVDEDIATDPFLYAWAPDPKYDSPLRKIQHLIFYIPFSFLFALWRVDTLQVAVDSVETKRPDAKNELWFLLAHYFALLTFFPLQVWVPAVFLSVLMSALIVTPTHQSEEYFEEYQPDWVTAQFRSTRNAVMTNPFSEWLWGGMQYQLEHHLFPSMPR